MSLPGSGKKGPWCPHRAGKGSLQPGLMHLHQCSGPRGSLRWRDVRMLGQRSRALPRQCRAAHERQATSGWGSLALHGTNKGLICHGSGVCLRFPHCPRHEQMGHQSLNMTCGQAEQGWGGLQSETHRAPQ